jgi:hypothetical protein
MDAPARTPLPMPSQQIAAIASEIVRRWLRIDPAEIDAEISTIGRTAIERSARELARQSGTVAEVESASLATLDAIVAQLSGEPSPARGWFGRKPVDTPKPDVAALVRTIEAERDAALRAVLLLQTDRARLAAAAVALDDAVSLIATVERLLLAAAREVAPERPDRAALLRGDVAAGVAVRRRDLMMQQTVLDHAIQAADLAAASHTALVEALDRARTLTVGAVQTAIAARNATGPMPGAGSGAAGTAGAPPSVSEAVARLNAALDRRERD